MHRMIGASLLAAAFSDTAASPAAAGASVFSHSTPGVFGYDVVSYQSGEKPLRGNGKHTAMHAGVTYLFVDEANRKAFERNPEGYIPAYGGYCAYGVSVGKKFTGAPEVWRVVDGRLYLNLDTGIQETWSRNLAENIEKADEKWTVIRDASPGEL